MNCKQLKAEDYEEEVAAQILEKGYCHSLYRVRERAAN